MKNPSVTEWKWCFEFTFLACLLESVYNLNCRFKRKEQLFFAFWSFLLTNTFFWENSQRIKACMSAHCTHFSFCTPFCTQLHHYVLATTQTCASQPNDCTEVCFANFFSGGFTTTAVINPLERKLAKTHHSAMVSFEYFEFWPKILLFRTHHL